MKVNMMILDSTYWMPPGKLIISFVDLSVSKAHHITNIQRPSFCPSICLLARTAQIDFTIYT